MTNYWEKISVSQLEIPSFGPRNCFREKEQVFLWDAFSLHHEAGRSHDSAKETDQIWWRKRRVKMSHVKGASADHGGQIRTRGSSLHCERTGSNLISVAGARLQAGPRRGLHVSLAHVPGVHPALTPPGPQCAQNVRVTLIGYVTYAFVSCRQLSLCPPSRSLIFNKWLLSSLFVVYMVQSCIELCMQRACSVHAACMCVRLLERICRAHMSIHIACYVYAPWAIRRYLPLVFHPRQCDHFWQAWTLSTRKASGVGCVGCNT